MAELDRDILKLSAIVVTGTITAMLDMTMVNVALAGMTRAFHAPITTVQWVSAAYLLSIAMVIPVTGRLAERYGPRTMWLVALGVFVGGSVLCGLARSAGSLIAFRAVQGLGGGMIVPLAIMMLATAAGPERRGRVMAIAAVPSQLAPIAGPLLGGLVVDAAGWRWIFWLNVPIGLLALLLSARGLPAGERGPARRLDVLGLALLSPALALLVFGLSGTEPLPLVAGAVLLVAFVGHALRTAESPLIDVRLFRHRALSAAAALNFLSRLSIFGASLLIPLYYQQIRGYAAPAAGLLMAPQSLGTMLALPVVGKLTDRLGARPVVLTGIGVSALAALGYTRVTATTPFPVLAASLLVWGIGVAAVAVPVSAAAYHGLPPAEIPGATSAITMIQTVGAAAGAAVLSAILLGRGGGAPAFAYTFRWVLIFGVLALGPALLLPAAPARQAERV